MALAFTYDALAAALTDVRVTELLNAHLFLTRAYYRRTSFNQEAGNILLAARTAVGDELMNIAPALALLAIHTSINWRLKYYEPPF